MKRFINCLIPVTACNLKCEYCYVPHISGRKTNKMPLFKYDAKYIRKALSKDRLGGVCLFNFCGEGETLLPHEVIDILKEILTEGHYVELVTNMTLSNRINEILQFDDDILSKLEFKCSFHYAELMRSGLLNTYIENVKRVIKSKASVTIEMVPDDSLIGQIPQIKELCIKNFGALCHITIPRDERTSKMKKLTSLSDKDFYNVWNKEFDSNMFRFKYSTFNIKRKEFCYAGDWALFLNLATGEAKQCYKSFYSQNIYRDLSKPIVFKPIGHMCLSPHCFNSHALMTLGLIPEIDTPNYESMRNRVMVNGDQWIKKDMKEIMSQKLSDDNKELSNIKKNFISIKNIIEAPYGAIKQVGKKYQKRIKDKLR